MYVDVSELSVISYMYADTVLGLKGSDKTAKTSFHLLLCVVHNNNRARNTQQATSKQTNNSSNESLPAKLLTWLGRPAFVHVTWTFMTSKFH